MRDMRVEWVDGDSRFVVATYDETTKVMTAAAASSGLITLTDGPDFELTFDDGELGILVFDSALHVEQFELSGATGRPVSPRVEFWVDRQRVASLTSDGALICPYFNEVTAVSGDGLFELKASGVLFATLGRSGLVCPLIEAP